MQKRSVDVAVIGAGTAGMNAFRAASKHSDSVVLIESGVYGTTCARVGCMPSKLLIAAAEAAHMTQTAHVFGVHLPRAAQIRGHEVMARVQRERDRFVGFVVEDVEAIPSEKRIMGKAKFQSKDKLLVDDRLEITAKAFVIATGSSSFVPEVLSDISEHIVTNDDVFEWDDLPDSVAVIGPGVIGLELGQALHRLGVRVTVFGRSRRVGPLAHPDLQQQAATIMGSELDLRLGVTIDRVRSHDDQAVIFYRDAAGDLMEQAYDKVLVTSGRLPNVMGLGLKTTGLKLDKNGVPNHDRYTTQCGSKPFFMAGDVMNEHLLLHEASDTGRIAGDNAGRFPDIRVGHRRSNLQIVFTDPQMAMIGLSWEEVQKFDHAVGSVSFENQGRSRVMNKNKGAMKVYAEQGTGQLLGAEIFGPSAEHLAHLLAWAHQHKMTVPHMLDLPFYHPVIEEGLRTALRKANAGLRFGAPPIKNCLDCGPGA